MGFIWWTIVCLRKRQLEQIHAVDSLLFCTGELTMDIMWWLIIANAAVWLGIGAYLVFWAFGRTALPKASANWRLRKDEHEDD